MVNHQIHQAIIVLDDLVPDVVPRKEFKHFGGLVFLAPIGMVHAESARIPQDYAIRPQCRAQHDPIREHVLKPNCATTFQWGGLTYDVRTNSLGFRDENVRDIPPVIDKPRILMLGDSFTQGMIAWKDSYIGMIAAHFPQYDVLNGAVVSYSPSNYYNTARIVLDQGVHIDEVIVFIDISDVADEAHIYQDVDASGAVALRPKNKDIQTETRIAMWDSPLADRFLVTNALYVIVKRVLVSLGFYRFATSSFSSPFDSTRGAWTYKSDEEIKREGITSYEPLGVEGGIAKEKSKMTRLWEELSKRNIPLSVVVYPWPSQLIHEKSESREVTIWRDWCAGKCKQFINVFPVFKAVQDGCPRIQPGCWYQKSYVFGDVHFNRFGNSLVADTVIKSLDQSPPVKLPLEKEQAATTKQ